MMAGSGSTLGRVEIKWQKVTLVGTQAWHCAFCDNKVASDRGWTGSHVRLEMGHHFTDEYFVVLCPRCELPTFIFPKGRQIPGIRFGEAVDHLPDDVESLYTEARYCMSVGSFTGAVLLGRKLLMHVAVTEGAEEGKSFAHYVDYLDQQRIVTSGMKEWVNEIRELGNDANHELVIAAREQAEELLNFVAMLLKVVYEYPEKGRRSVAARKDKASSE
jgi:hypothetical protein